MFLFENYMDGSAALKMDDAAVTVELEHIGFERYEIERAFHWLSGLMEIQAAVSTDLKITPFSIRHYSLDETDRLGLEGIGHLFYLEQLGILDAATREIVIDRVMALDNRIVDIPRIRWVALMALFNQPDKKAPLSLLQNMVMADAFNVLH